MTAKALPPALRFVSPRELAERLEAERRGTPFLLYLDESRHQHIVELVPGQTLTIGREPDSEVRLERYMYAPGEGGFAMVLKFARGVAAYVSGRMAKLAPDAIRLETPSAIVGVRGTTVAIRVEQ